MAHTDRTAVLFDPPRSTISAHVFKLCYERRVLAEARLLALDRWAVERDKALAEKAAAEEAAAKAEAEAQQRAAEAAQGDAQPDEKAIRRQVREERSARKSKLLADKQKKALLVLKEQRLQEHKLAQVARQRTLAAEAIERDTKRATLEKQAAKHRADEQSLTEQLLQLEEKLEGMAKTKHALVVQLKQAIRKEEELKAAQVAALPPGVFKSPAKPVPTHPDAHRLIPPGQRPPEHPTGPEHPTLGAHARALGPSEGPAGLSGAPVSPRGSLGAWGTPPKGRSGGPFGAPVGPSQGTPAALRQPSTHVASPMSLEDGEVVPSAGGNDGPLRGIAESSGGALAALGPSASIDYQSKMQVTSTPEPGEIGEIEVGDIAADEEMEEGAIQ